MYTVFSSIRFMCDRRVVATLVMLAFPLLAEAGVQVTSATYGPNCGAPRDNVKAQLAAACDGQVRCDYVVDFRILGDPAPGCAKTFVVEWICAVGATTRIHKVDAEAGLGSHVVLACNSIVPTEIPGHGGVPKVAGTLQDPGITHIPAEVVNTLKVEAELAGGTPISPNIPATIHWKLTNITPVRSMGMVEVTLGGQPIKVQPNPPPIDLQPQAMTEGQFAVAVQPGGAQVISVRYLRDTGETLTVPNGPGGLKQVPRYTDAGYMDVPFTVAVDQDHDGIDDGLEHALLEKYRPYLLFSHDGRNEELRPADPWWYVQRSELLPNGDEDGSPVVPLETLRLNPKAILIDQSAQGSSIITRTPAQSNFHINPRHKVAGEPGDDPAYQGNPWPQPGEPHNIGLFGHVVPVKLSDPYGYDFNKRYDGSATGDVYYKIEYWQFFGYNGAHKTSNIADHEGDWTSVQLIVDPRHNNIATSIFHFAHGLLFRFDMTPQNNARTSVFQGPDGEIKEWNGINYNFQSQSLDLSNLILGGIPPQIENDYKALEKAQNNVLRMFRDRTTGEFTHPVVYLENGTHEFYPSPAWRYYGAPNHNGEAEHYLTDTPPNLGEVEFPLNENRATTIVLHFNGIWGAFNKYNDPPPGPILHKNWLWPADSSIRWQIQNQLGY
jgi:hypothetical protein